MPEITWFGGMSIPAPTKALGLVSAILPELSLAEVLELCAQERRRIPTEAAAGTPAPASTGIIFQWRATLFVV